MTDPTQSFARRLRDFRTVLKLTQEELAERAGLSTRAISDLERGIKTRPHRDTIDRLSEALALSPDEALSFLEAARFARHATTSRAKRPASNLPVPPHAILGRERELTLIADLLVSPSIQVLTLTGTGGTGKTRLAIEAATRVGVSCFGQVAIVSLGMLTTADLVGETIAHTLGFQETTEEQLLGVMATQRLLLVLNNFEHVLAAAPLVARLVARSPELTILATSRAPLGIAAEQVFPVAPLPRPSLERGGVPGSFPAVNLFIERALAVNPTLALPPPEMEAIAEICDRLDGLPLAIELAAARCRLLTPRSIAARLERRLPLLTGGGPDVPPRHQTLQRALSWSYDLLSSDNQAAFRYLSVFRGGFTLEAVTELESGRLPGTHEDEVLERLFSLAGQSLIERDVQEYPDQRFTMLETLRAYGVGLLQDLGELSGAEMAHAEYFARLALAAEPELKGPDQLLWFSRLEQEHANLRAALEWSLQTDPDQAVAIGGALIRFWDHHGHRREGLQWLAAVLDSSAGATSPLRGKLLWGRGTLAQVVGDHDGANIWLTEGVESALAAGDLYHAGFALNTLGSIASDRGDEELALAYHKEGLSLLRQVGDEDGVAALLGNVGYDLMLQGDLDGAIDHCTESLILYRNLISAHGCASMLLVLGRATLLAGQTAASGDHLREGIRFAQLLGNTIYLIYFLQALASLAAAEGKSERSATLFAATTTLAAQMSYELRPFARVMGERFQAMTVATLGHERWMAICEEAGELSLEAMIDRALGSE